MIDSVYEMIAQAARLPAKYKESMTRVLEDWKAQFKQWNVCPEKLTMDEACHKGIVYLTGRLLEK